MEQTETLGKTWSHPTGDNDFRGIYEYLGHWFVMRGLPSDTFHFLEVLFSAAENYGMAGHIPQHTQPAIAELLDRYYDELYKDGTGHSKVREFIEYVRQQQASAQ